MQTLRENGLGADGALGDYRPLRALAAAVETFKPDRLVISTLPEADSAWLRYDVLDRAREAYPAIPVTHIVVQPQPEVTGVEARPQHTGTRPELAGGIGMTVVVGLSPGERVPPGVTLGAMLARSANQRLVVTAVVPEPWPPNPYRSDEEFLAYQASAAEKALAEARAHVGDDLAADYVLRRGRSVSSGLLDVAEENDASCIVLGSSSNGALNRVALGGIADRILHSSGVPVAVAPRGASFRAGRRLSRVTVAFGRGDGDSDLLAQATDRAMAVGARLRVACFAVRPLAPVATTLAGAAADAEDLVTDRWVGYLKPIIAATLERTTSHPSAETVDIVVGQGSSWAAALSDIAWTDDEILVIGTSSSPIGRLFLGSHAAKIVRYSPVPVMLVPRSVVAGPSKSN